ncbi:MAG: DegT/DnrJ/EryC1/StrS family aminotransferase [Patescibacteria group bacterium]|jgi:dTDP-4-amino-4,6-dideoxygalactose transaminase
MSKNKTIPFFDYLRQYRIIKPKLNIVFERVLASGQLILGPEAKKLEINFAKYLGARHAIGVNSGTDALKIGLKALKIGSGDEVITVANTFIATISAIRETGAKPVFVDIKNDFTINEKLIAKAITKKTKAILPVHLYGQAANMPTIMAIAKKYKLKVIEDCAQSVGAKIGSKYTGSFGHLACFSFYPTKNLGAYGDGGMIVTNNKKLAQICRQLRCYGTSKKNFAELEGYNSRLDEVQAAILSVKLKHLNKWNNQRHRIAEYYLNNIHNQKIILPLIKNPTGHAWHLFVVQVKNRDKFIHHLKANKIDYGIHYQYPIFEQTAYKFLKVKKTDFPQTSSVAKKIVSLPMFPELTKAEMAYIVKKLNQF